MWRRWLTLGNVFTVALLLFAAPRLLPHLGAVVGVDSGDGAPRFDSMAIAGQSIYIGTEDHRVICLGGK